MVAEKVGKGIKVVFGFLLGFACLLGGFLGLSAGFGVSPKKYGLFAFADVKACLFPLLKSF